jgi:hypothetical protein
MVPQRHLVPGEVMPTFSDLVQPIPGVEPGPRQELADSRFPQLAASHGFRVWRPDDPIPHTGERMLIGVATYSTLEMDLLDRLTPLVASLKPRGCVIELFNVRDVQSMADFEQFVPGIGSVYQTPIAGLWAQGLLVAKGTGAKARELIWQWVQGPGAGSVSPARPPLGRTA